LIASPNAPCAELSLAVIPPPASLILNASILLHISRHLANLADAKTSSSPENSNRATFCLSAADLANHQTPCDCNWNRIFVPTMAELHVTWTSWSYLRVLLSLDSSRASSLDSGFPPMPKSPLFTSSITTHVKARNFSRSIETIASVNFRIISCFSTCVKTFSITLT
jgi:hypothetical protein